MIKLEQLITLEKQSDVDIRYCEIISDGADATRRARILKDGDRYFLHEMRNGIVSACFEIAVDWRISDKVTIFAYTPDDRHIYQIDSRRPLARSVLGRKSAEVGERCEYGGHTVELAENAIIFDGKYIPVEVDHGYVYKILKTKIKAIGGAAGLFCFLDKIAEEKKSGESPLFAQVYKIIAENF